MTGDVVIQTLGLVFAASLPSLIGLVKMSRAKQDLDLLKEQILPGNGRKLHQYITDLERETLALRDGLIDVKFELKAHTSEHEHPTPLKKVSNKRRYTGGAASIGQDSV